MHFEARDIDKTKLPLNKDIIQYILYLKRIGVKNVKNQSLSRYVAIVVNETLSLWNTTDIPVISKTAIRKMLIRLIDLHYQINKRHKKYIENEWQVLFCISKCKCSVQKKSKCMCPESNRIPISKLKLFIDQCGPRRLNLENDPPSQKGNETLSQTAIDPSISTIEYEPDSSEEDAFNIEGNNSIDMLNEEQQLKVSDISLQNFAIALDRTSISDRFGSLLATTLIKDLRISIAHKYKANREIGEKMTAFFDNLIIDKNKIQRERAKFRIEAKTISSNNYVLKGISYDGKKDLTLKKQTVGQQNRIYRTVEEHITIVQEPNSVLLGYATPISGTGISIQKALVDFLASEGHSLNYLTAISCDGTSVNTGYRTGVNACLERYLQRPLQWNVCLYHFNELPLKNLLTKLVGKQSGPGIWAGEFGSELLSCHLYPVSLIW